MRTILTLVIALSVLAACDEGAPKVAASEKVVATSANRGAMWPLMLQHCLRSPTCDPTSDFGKGAGEASGGAAEISWFAQSKDVVKEGAEDYGALVQVSLNGTRGAGGRAGRPLTVDEVPSTLDGANARRSTLTVEYRTPGGAAPEAYFLQFRSAQLALNVPAAKAARTHEAAVEAIGDALEAMKHADGCEGARIEVTGKAGVLFSDCSLGLAAGDEKPDRYAAKVEPWAFYVSRNLRDEPLPALMAAIAAGETLGLKIRNAAGDIMLADAFYTLGYDKALAEGTAALADPELAKPIEERCARFAKEAPEFWKLADVTAALHVCDPRTPQQRLRDELSASAPAKPQ